MSLLATEIVEDSDGVRWFRCGFRRRGRMLQGRWMRTREGAVKTLLGLVHEDPATFVRILDDHELATETFDWRRTAAKAPEDFPTR